MEITVRQSHALVERKGSADGVEEVIVSDEDDAGVEESFEGDTVDLTEVLRQDLVLALPMNPCCETAGQADCAYDEAAQPSGSDEIDPRWAPLLELKKKLN